MHQPGQSIPNDAAAADGVVKAAIVLLSLDHDAAGELLKHLPTEVVEKVTQALASLGDVPPGLSDKVIEEFCSLRMAGMHGRPGGLQHAKTLLEGSLEGGPADDEVVQARVPRTPFSFLHEAESDDVLTFIQDEHPQTIALIISHLNHRKASEILAGLPPERQLDVARRVANMEQTDPEVVQEVESALESRLSDTLAASMGKAGGAPAIVEVLNLRDRGTGRSVLEGIGFDDPHLVDQSRRPTFAFEDILEMGDEHVRAVLAELDDEELCAALTTASDELKQKIFTNMSARAVERIKRDMECMGPVRLSDVEAAQQRIMDVVLRLEAAGEIFIQCRGERDVLV